LKADNKKFNSFTRNIFFFYSTINDIDLSQGEQKQDDEHQTHFNHDFYPALYPVMCIFLHSIYHANIQFNGAVVVCIRPPYTHE